VTLQQLLCKNNNRDAKLSSRSLLFSNIPMGYDDRRQEVADAAWRTIVREGLDRTSMRAIAQELGTSTGVVTHYFRDKDELTLFALERVFQKMLGDMAAAIAGHQGTDRLEQMVLATLPLRAADLPAWQIWIAFLGYAIGRDRLMKEHQKRYEFLQKMLVEQLTELQADRLLRADLDLSLESNGIIAMVDGIGTGFVINPHNFPADLQKNLICRHLQTLYIL
jgi:AcrR family transcriptional regulator